MNQVLKLALEIAKGNQIYLNRGEKLPYDLIDKNPNSSLFNSLYFCKDGMEFRISNHELPNRDFMCAHPYVSNEIAKANGFTKLYHKNNIEIIVNEGHVVNKLNFN